MTMEAFEPAAARISFRTVAGHVVKAWCGDCADYSWARLYAVRFDTVKNGFGSAKLLPAVDEQRVMVCSPFGTITVIYNQPFAFAEYHEVQRAV
jgi:hypothetical protein